MSDKKVVYLLFMIVLVFGMGYGAVKSLMFSNQLFYTNEYEMLDGSEGEKGAVYQKADDSSLSTYLILYDEEEPASMKVKENVEQTLKYMKKQYRSDSNLSAFKISSKLQAVFITFEDLDKMDKIEELFQYVQAGGRLIFMERSVPGSNFERYKEEMGIAGSTGFQLSQGIRLLDEILICKAGYDQTETFIENSCLNVSLMAGTEIYAESLEEDPMLWYRRTGEGSVVYFNGTMMGEPANRGMIPSLMALGQEELIYPILNAEVLFIDDFSSPIPAGNMSVDNEQLKLSIDQFYKTIWWTDLLGTAQKFGLKYSGMIIENYNDQVEGSFKDTDPTASGALLYFGRELLANKGELGYHGYNHQSLTEDQNVSDVYGYHAWRKMEDVQASLKELDRFTRNVLPHYQFRSYVAPSNVMSQTIRDQFPKLMPQVKVISSLYTEGQKGEAYTQEFEVAEDGIIEFPRISSGYTPDQSDKWSIYNGITLHGVVSHFVHPDDVLDQVRGGGKTWEVLYKSYDTMLTEINKDYSWLRPMTISEAADALKRYEQTEVYFKEESGSLQGQCDHMKGEMYFILKTTKKIMKYEDCSGERIGEDTFLICTDKPVFTIRMEGGKEE